MQIHIRPCKTVDAAELQSAILETVGHIGPWLDWATPRYSLVDVRSRVSKSRILWARQTTYRWLITDEDLRNVWGSVEIGRPVPGLEARRMRYWIRRQALGNGSALERREQRIITSSSAVFLTKSIFISFRRMNRVRRLRENSAHS